MYPFPRKCYEGSTGASASARSLRSGAASNSSRTAAARSAITRQLRSNSSNFSATASSPTSGEVLPIRRSTRLRGLPAGSQDAMVNWEGMGEDSSGHNKMDGSGLKGGGTAGEGEGEDGAKAMKGSTGGQSMDEVGNFMPAQSLIADGYQKVE